MSAERIGPQTYRFDLSENHRPTVELLKTLPSNQASASLSERLSRSALNYYHTPFVVVEKGKEIPNDSTLFGEQCYIVFSHKSSDGTVRKIYTNPPTAFIETTNSGPNSSIVNLIKLRFVILRGPTSDPPPVGCIIWSPGLSYRFGSEAVTLDEDGIKGGVLDANNLVEGYKSGIVYPGPRNNKATDSLTEIALDLQMFKCTGHRKTVGKMTFLKVLDAQAVSDKSPFSSRYNIKKKKWMIPSFYTNEVKVDLEVPEVEVSLPEAFSFRPTPEEELEEGQLSYPCFIVLNNVRRAIGLMPPDDKSTTEIFTGLTGIHALRFGDGDATPTPTPPSRGGKNGRGSPPSETTPSPAPPPASAKKNSGRAKGSGSRRRRRNNPQEGEEEQTEPSPEPPTPTPTPSPPHSPNPEEIFSDGGDQPPAPPLPSEEEGGESGDDDDGRSSSSQKNELPPEIKALIDRAFDTLPVIEVDMRYVDYVFPEDILAEYNAIMQWYRSTESDALIEYKSLISRISDLLKAVPGHKEARARFSEAFEEFQGKIMNNVSPRSLGPQMRVKKFKTDQYNLTVETGMEIDAWNKLRKDINEYIKLDLNDVDLGDRDDTLSALGRISSFISENAVLSGTKYLSGNLDYSPEYLVTVLDWLRFLTTKLRELTKNIDRSVKSSIDGYKEHFNLKEEGDSDGEDEEKSEASEEGYSSATSGDDDKRGRSPRPRRHDPSSDSSNIPKQRPKPNPVAPDEKIDRPDDKLADDEVITVIYTLPDKSTWRTRLTTKSGYRTLSVDEDEEDAQPTVFVSKTGKKTIFEKLLKAQGTQATYSLRAQGKSFTVPYNGPISLQPIVFKKEINLDSGGLIGMEFVYAGTNSRPVSLFWKL